MLKDMDMNSYTGYEPYFRLMFGWGIIKSYVFNDTIALQTNNFNITVSSDDINDSMPILQSKNALLFIYFLNPRFSYIVLT